MSLSILEPVKDKNLEILRLIRNQCRYYMTNNNQEISFEEQITWFQNLDTKNNKVYLFKVDCYGFFVPVGYGIVKFSGNSGILTGGLNESSRNKGLGLDLFSKLIEICREYDKVPELEVLNSNYRAIALYEKLGFIKIEQYSNKIRMVMNK
jgi:ribosomal protein S18 acetylase RimI-like enzyme